MMFIAQHFTWRDILVEFKTLHPVSPGLNTSMFEALVV